jgi:hypothetical protein
MCLGSVSIGFLRNHFGGRYRMSNDERRSRSIAIRTAHDETTVPSLHGPPCRLGLSCRPLTVITNESIVWYVAGTKLIGFNGENGMPVFTGGGASDGVGNINKFQTPIVAKGRIFLAAGNAISAYTLH